MKVKKNIPYYDYPRAYTDDRDNFLGIIEDVGSRGAFILQKDLKDFEDDLAKYISCEHAVGVANATDGLELALMAIGLKPGDEVICCSHTMLATASSIVTAGGVPVPVDIGYDNLIDPDAIASAITPRTVGIMPTQLNGRVCDMDRIMALALKYSLFVVEDAAQALGARYKGKFAGTFGVASSFSFYPAKVLGSLGDGGAVVTNSYQMYDKLFQLHDHGRDLSGEVKSWGRNSRLDNLQAAILKFRLSSYDDVIKRRREIAAIYQQRLAHLDELNLPPAPDADEYHFDIYQNYELQAQKRDALKEHLRINGVGTLIQWGGKAVHQWEHLGFSLHLPAVERFFKYCIMLPMNTFISNDDVHYICDSIDQFYRG